METLDQTNTLFSQKAINAMKAAGPWMKFIAIVFFVFSFFMLIASFYLLGSIPLQGFISLVITGVFIYTSIQLLGMGASISSMNMSSQSIDSFFSKCKNYFIVWGVVLIIYILLLLYSLIKGGAAFGAVLEGMS
ncbi:MAG: hypothetical protein CMP67_06640 [Flavobacteriales bacterium]|nr:hypothetical protein [Flavobacteriales bacterium]|tara:strand:+ start:161 stop:562 length:402 start_codon:yes stop_codon:yes gene_type:complete